MGHGEDQEVRCDHGLWIVVEWILYIECQIVVVNKLKVFDIPGTSSVYLSFKIPRLHFAGRLSCASVSSDPEPCSSFFAFGCPAAAPKGFQRTIANMRLWEVEMLATAHHAHCEGFSSNYAILGTLAAVYNSISIVVMSGGRTQGSRSSCGVGSMEYHKLAGIYTYDVDEER